MKIILPELDIAPDNGFSSDIDIFDRAAFGGRLANLIANAEDNPVFALDSGWGEGKSTFIKMWRGFLSHQREQKIKTIYFDAFKNDYQKDSFLALASEMYQLISPENKEKQKTFREKAIKAATSLSRGAIKIAIKSATAGIVDGSIVDSVKEEISDLIAGQVDDIVKDKFKHAEQDKLALEEFKKQLEKFAEEVGEAKPIIFIIDELDRCKPDFALNLLEQIKHLFSVKGITFLLVTNRKQLEESIKIKYGKDIDPTNYLHKFVHLWITLPRRGGEIYDDHGIKFFQYALKGITNAGERIENEATINAFQDIIRFYQPSYREIGRMLSYFSVIHNMSGKTKYYANWQLIVAMVCFLKACRPSVLLPKNGKLSSEKIIAESNLNDVEEGGTFELLNEIKKLIIFDLGSDEQRKGMISRKEIYLDGLEARMGSGSHMISDINKWLSEINTAS